MQLGKDIKNYAIHAAAMSHFDLYDNIIIYGRSQSGLRAIPNALCCEDHFDWYVLQCPLL